MMVATYFAKLKKLIWDELINYKQILVHNYKGVTMESTKRHEKEKKFQFLLALDTTCFGNMQSILREDPSPNLNHAYSKIIQE